MTKRPASAARSAGDKRLARTALATALALVPLVIAGNQPGHEIEHPMAVVILGGLVSSTLMNLVLMPAMYLRFNQPPSASDQPVAAKMVD